MAVKSVPNKNFFETKSPVDEGLTSGKTSRGQSVPKQVAEATVKAQRNLQRLLSGDTQTTEETQTITGLISSSDSPVSKEEKNRMERKSSDIWLRSDRAPKRASWVKALLATDEQITETSSNPLEELYG